MRRTLLFIVGLFAVARAVHGGINPLNPGFPLVGSTPYGTFENNNYSAICVACHLRNPSAYTPPVNGLGSHFVYGGPAVTTKTDPPEFLDPWEGGARSKYGKVGDNVNVTGVKGEMICESCHNMVSNTGIYKLVVTDNNATDPSALCEGCHGEVGSPAHLVHPLTGDFIGTKGRTLRNTSPANVRNPPLDNSEMTYPGTDAMNCRSCHRPHDAQTGTAARILKRGWGGQAGAAVSGIGDNTGLQRQSDMEPPARLVTDFEPMCNACHFASMGN